MTFYAKPGELPFKVNYQEGTEKLVKEFATHDEAQAFRATLIPATKLGALPTRMPPREPDPAVKPAPEAAPQAAAAQP